MIEDSSGLVNGQKLKVDLARVGDRLPPSLIDKLIADPFGTLVGYKMVDGNSFGLVLELRDGTTSWFFENELLEIEET